MKRLVLFFLAFVFVSNPSFSSNKIIKDINLSAHIDNENFFSYSVTKFGFEDSLLEIDYDIENTQFKSKSSKLIIETDIPTGVFLNAGFEITAEELKSTCSNNQQVEVAKNFAKYYLDGRLLKEGESLPFEQFNESSEIYLKDTELFSIKFDKTPELDIKRVRCNGSAVVYISLSL